MRQCMLWGLSVSGAVAAPTVEPGSLTLVEPNLDPVHSSAWLVVCEFVRESLA